jgi:hypothetical protein
MADRWSANANLIPQHATNANLIPQQHAANASLIQQPHAANADLIPQQHATNVELNSTVDQSIVISKSMQDVISYLRDKADLVLGGNANVARIPISNSGVDERNSASDNTSYSYPHELAPIAHANANTNANENVNNANSNASLLSGIDQITFRDQPVDGLDYDAVVENEMAAVVVNPIDDETQLMNELLHDAVGKNEGNFRNYLVNNNAAVEKIALLDKLRHRNGRSAPISECALKLLRLLHEPNHPLIDQRKRLFMTVTGYKKNWRKKCRKDHVHDTERPDN